MAGAARFVGAGRLICGGSLLLAAVLYTRLVVLAVGLLVASSSARLPALLPALCVQRAHRGQPATAGGRGAAGRHEYAAAVSSRRLGSGGGASCEHQRRRQLCAGSQGSVTLGSRVPPTVADIGVKQCARALGMQRSCGTAAVHCSRERQARHWKEGGHTQEGAALAAAQRALWPAGGNVAGCSL